jgi:hypothetical protein
LSALKRSRALHRASPHKAVIFGGKYNLQLRSLGKITAEEWKAKRLLPLYFEGHAKSYAEQGGNHRFVLDIEHNTVWFYPKAKVALPLQIKLGKKSNYRELLEALQSRCTWHRDVPFTVSLTSTHLSISWDEKVETLKRKTNPNRVLALDLNPNRIGAAVLERAGKACKPLKWTVYDYPELNRKLSKASDHSDSIQQRDKRVHELSCIAKEIIALAAHFRCSAVITEHLNIQSQDHGKGRSFNRAVNNPVDAEGVCSAAGPPAGGRRHSAQGSEPGLQLQAGQFPLGLALIDPRPGLRGRGVGPTISSRRPEKLRAHKWRKPTEGRTPSAGIARCRGSRGVEAGLESTSPPNLAIHPEHAACLEAKVPGSVSKSEPVQGATVTCVTPGTRSDSGRFAHLHAQRLMTLCIAVPTTETPTGSEFPISELSAVCWRSHLDRPQRGV